MAKLPGKTEYSGRRRAVTRRSGFHAHNETSGGEFRRLHVPTHPIDPSSPVVLTFQLPHASRGEFQGYGTWFSSSIRLTIEIEGGPPKRTVTHYPPPSWNKLGSMWLLDQSAAPIVRVSFRGSKAGVIALAQATCGIIRHKHLTGARTALLANMHEFSPEAHFFEQLGNVEVQCPPTTPVPPSLDLLVKSCNRCARYLPINIPEERHHLSFSSHCVAPHRRPCKHRGFGILANPDTDEVLTLDYGYQLECRFCKKFEVNAAHNPQRTTSQMKEDAQRRRGFELLIARMNGGSPQLRYRLETGRELADDVAAKFGYKCFACGHTLTARRWHLDHTRPLALLWPLDKTATALCAGCNSRKRDRAPVDFYSPKKLKELARITGIPLAELKHPVPNMSVVNALVKMLDWFFDEFLAGREFQANLDGKRPAELLVKALRKTLNKCPGGAPIDIMAAYDRRRGGSHGR